MFGMVLGLIELFHDLLLNERRPEQPFVPSVRLCVLENGKLITARLAHTGLVVQSRPGCGQCSHSGSAQWENLPQQLDKLCMQ